MFCSTISAGLNIVFDYLFIYVFHFGVIGAAYASQLGETISSVILIYYFVSKKGKLRFVRFKLDDCLNIIKTGLPELMTNLSEPICVLVFNIIIIKNLGALGVASYAIISYIADFVITVYCGVSQGMQPIISNCYGRKNMLRLSKTLKLGIHSGLLLSLITYFVVLKFGVQIISIFTNSEELIKSTFDALRIYGLSFLIAPINIVYIAYFTSVGNTKAASVFSLFRGVILIVIFALIIPKIVGVEGIWMSIVFVEATVLSCIMIYNIATKNNSIDNVKRKLLINAAIK